MQDAVALGKVKQIVEAHVGEPDGVVVVLSATSGTTSQILQLIQKATLSKSSTNEHSTKDDNSTEVGHSTKNGNFTKNDNPSKNEYSIRAELVVELEQISARHIGIVHQLVQDGDVRATATEAVRKLCAELHKIILSVHTLGEYTPQTADEAASYGESISTCILFHALQANGIDAVLFDVRQIIKTNDKFQSAKVDFSESGIQTKLNLLSNAVTGRVFVTQGFIGSTADNITTTLGRGGSDYSAALIGAFTGSTEIKIYTDVSGVFSADPRVVPSAHPIASLSFDEVREMALYGAKVLHPDTIAPAVERGIPVRVLNTFAPDDLGTVITGQNSTTDRLHAVCGLKNCVMLNGKSAEVDSVIRSGNFVHNIVLRVSGIERSMVVLQLADSDARDHVVVSAVGSDLKSTDVHVIALCGPAASAPSTMAEVSRVCSAFSTRALATGISRTISFVVCDAADSTELVCALHELTTPLE